MTTGMRRCQICDQGIPNNEFGEHIDGHSDSQLERWPGGFAALDEELTSSMGQSMLQGLEE